MRLTVQVPSGTPPGLSPTWVEVGGEQGLEHGLTHVSNQVWVHVAPDVSVVTGVGGSWRAATAGGGYVIIRGGGFGQPAGSFWEGSSLLPRHNGLERLLWGAETSNRNAILAQLQQ